MHTTQTRPLAILAAGLLLSALAPAGLLAATDTPQDCTLHEPIRILEDHGEFGFTWDDPVTGEQVYRPGSGVVAGDGSASNPYAIEGWCISGADWDPPNMEIKMCGFDFGDHTPDPESTGVIICGTSEHFVLRDSTLNLWEHGTGIGNVTADTGQVEHTSHENNTYHLYIDRAPGVGVRHNKLHGFDTTQMLFVTETAISGQGDDVTLEHNDLVGAGTLVNLDGDGLMFRNNLLDSSGTVHVETQGSNQTLANNTLQHTVLDDPPLYGLWVDGTDVLVEANQVDGYESLGFVAAPAGVGIAFANNTATGTGTGFSVSGTDARVHNSTVTGGSTGVSTAASAVNATIENVTVDGADRGLLAYKSQGTTFTHADVSGYMGPGVRVDAAENVTLRSSNLEDTNGTGLEVLDTDTTVRAQNNWWGCPEGPEDPACDDVVGDAGYSPWLTAPKPQAGAGT